MDASSRQLENLLFRSLRYPAAGLASAVSQAVEKTGASLGAAFLVGPEGPVELLAAAGRGAAVLGAPGPAPDHTRLIRDFARETEPKSSPPPEGAPAAWAPHASMARICTSLSDEENAILVLAGESQIEPEELSDVSVPVAVLVRLDLLTRQTERFKAELQRARQDRSLLAAGLQHDLRTPLTSIMGAAMTLRDSSQQLPEEERIQILDMLIAQSRRLTAMLEDALSRATEEGDAPVVIRRVQLDELAGRVAGAARLARKGEIVIEAPPTMIATDPDRLERALLNLLDNALKQTPADEAVRLVAERSSKGWTLTVADAGPGVPEELVSTLFTPRATGSERGAGFGLGLYSVGRLTSELGGHVKYSRREGWTRFSIFLPSSASPSSERSSE